MIQGQIAWFELPVVNLDRAVMFYSKVLDLKIEKISILNTQYGIINKSSNIVKGALVERQDHKPGKGVILFFYVHELIRSLQQVELNGGEILVRKTLLKQMTNDGFLAIKQNLINDEIGYYAEFVDCEGNRICLYSNS